MNYVIYYLTHDGQKLYFSNADGSRHEWSADTVEWQLKSFNRVRNVFYKEPVVQPEVEYYTQVPAPKDDPTNGS